MHDPNMTHRHSVLCLASIAALVVAMSSSGCTTCLGADEQTVVESYERQLSGEQLQHIREVSEGDETECMQACLELFSFADQILSCSTDTEDPWNPAHEEVTVVCEVEETGIFCEGRRPHGHREANVAVTSFGSWFAVHAHLERASVRAFAELADWLMQHSAPTGLVERCRAAARDEVVHAQMMTICAHRHGAEVPPCEVVPCTQTLREVALLNAVEGCVFESFAAMMGMVQAEHAADPELRSMFSTIARDELRHGQLAWDLHAWLMTRLESGDKADVLQAQRHALTKLPERAAVSSAATPTELGSPQPDVARAMARQFASLLATANERRVPSFAQETGLTT